MYFDRKIDALLLVDRSVDMLKHTDMQPYAGMHCFGQVRRKAQDLPALSESYLTTLK